MLCRFPNSITTTCNFPVYGKVTGKRSKWILGINSRVDWTVEDLTVLANRRSSLAYLRPVHTRQQSCRKRQQIVARNGDFDRCCDNVAVSGNICCRFRQQFVAWCGQAFNCAWPGWLSFATQFHFVLLLAVNAGYIL